ncbi:hypothetical protein HDU82_005452 [Entophlyctis luteolus]|nr:hypothetical protein HDU82_005452 [Entophlyctis luteolus]
MSISAFVHYREDTFLYPLKSTDVPTLSKRIFIEDNSRSLFLSCRGGAAIGQHQFTPTILLETGLSLTAVVSWNDTLLGSLSKIGQVSEDSDDLTGYDDRYGWSDSGPMPQTAKRNAMALHSLVESAGEVGPFILVGHSFGGHMIRIFAHYYPEKVAGLVFLDSSHEDDFEATAALFPSKSVADWHGEFRQLAFSTGIVAALGSTFAVADRQLVSVFEKTQGGHSYSGREIAATFRGKFFKALSSELLNFVFVSTSQVRKTVPVSPRMDLPVAVLIATDEVAQYCTPITSAHTIPSSFTNIDMSLPANESGLCVPIRAHSDRAPSLEAALAQSHYQCQWKLATQLGTLSRVLFSTGGHYVMFDDMNAVVRAVEDVFHEAKRIARANAIAWQENTKGEYSFEPDENEL